MRVQLPVLRTLAVLGVVLSGASLAENLVSGSICPFGSSCEAVTASPYSRLFGVPLPIIGLAGFSLLLGVLLFPHLRIFVLVRPLTLVAGLSGIALWLVQVFVLRQICGLCVFVDAVAVAIAIVAFAGRPCRDSLRWSWRSTWLGVALFGLIVPLVIVFATPAPPVPEKVKALWQEGKITLVEVTDFECRHCRQTEDTLAAFLKQHGDQVQLVRIIAPRSEWTRETNSWAAARAYLAARGQDKGEAMARLLFKAQATSPPFCRELAASIGIDMTRYDQEMASEKYDTELRANVAWAKKLAPGLPVIWLQAQPIFGEPNLELLNLQFERARKAGK